MIVPIEQMRADGLRVRERRAKACALTTARNISIRLGDER
jgi:hypothetical protein